MDEVCEEIATQIYMAYRSWSNAGDNMDTCKRLCKKLANRPNVVTAHNAIGTFRLIVEDMQQSLKAMETAYAEIQ